MEIVEKNKKIYVESDYNTRFISGARKLHGKWERPYWVFDSEDKKYVYELLEKVYGESITPKAKVKVHIDLDKLEEAGGYSSRDDNFEEFGRVICERRGRDQDVKLHPSVIIVSGGFRGSGGSRNYPELNSHFENTILEVKNVVLDQAEKMVERYPSAIRIVSENEVLLQQWEAEKETLLKRLEEVNEKICYYSKEIAVTNIEKEGDSQENE